MYIPGINTAAGTDEILIVNKDSIKLAVLPYLIGNFLYRKPSLPETFVAGIFFIRALLSEPFFAIWQKAIIALRRRGSMSLPRSAAGGESCKQDSFLLYRKFLNSQK